MHWRLRAIYSPCNVQSNFLGGNTQILTTLPRPLHYGEAGLVLSDLLPQQMEPEGTKQWSRTIGRASLQSNVLLSLTHWVKAGNCILSGQVFELARGFSIPVVYVAELRLFISMLTSATSRAGKLRALATSSTFGNNMQLAAGSSG